MRRLVATSLLLLICSGVLSGCGLLGGKNTSNAQAALETFEGESFRIKLPCTPDLRTDPVPGFGRGVSVRTWTCEDDVSAYGVSTVKLPKGLQGDLDGAVQGGAEAVNGTVTSQKKITYAGAPGRDVRIESTFDGRPAVTFVRIVLHQRTLYQVQLVQPREDAKEPPSRYRTIVESLSFT